MNKLIKKVIFFLLPICVFLTIYEVMIRHIENDYSYKNNWFSRNSDNIELLAIGHSQCYHGINPDLLSLRAFNAGHEAQSSKYNYLIFNKYYEQMTSLRFLVMPIVYGEPFYDMENSPAKNLIKNYSIYYKLQDKKLKNHCEFLQRLNFSALGNYLLNGTTLKSCKDNGYFNYSTTHNENWQDKAITDAKKLSIDSSSSTSPQELCHNYCINMAYFEQIINLCKARNIQVILLTTPAHKLFRDNINQEEWTITTDFCHHLVQEFDNVSYINMFHDSRFVDDDFWDSLHLNETGATKLSLILNDYINENFPN